MSGANCTKRTMYAVFILYLIACCSVEADLDVSPMEKTELEALYSTIQGFVGSWWNGSDLYPDPCGWTPIQGVSCDLFDGVWYVTELNIGPVHDNSLSCTENAGFKPQLFELVHLKSLSFFNCFISSQRSLLTIPNKNWEKLSGSLESLELRSNPGLVGTIPSGFGTLTKLQSLVLLENGFPGEIPTNFGNLISLRKLVLAGNRLSGRIPNVFGLLHELLILDLSRNQFSGPLPSTLGSLNSLLKLDLSHNLLEGSLIQEFANLKNLTLLDLRSNKISGGSTKSLQEMYSLQEMVLSNNPIGGNLMSVNWKNLQSLVILDVSNMGLVGEIPETLSELKRLRFLDLSDNNLTGNISPKLETLPCLGSLYLNRNNLAGYLKFSEGFYQKMGRRFGAWNNSNLCFQAGSLPTMNVPYGVKPCQQQQEVTMHDGEAKSTAKLGNGGPNQISHDMVSLGFIISSIKRFQCVFLVETLMIGLFLT